MPNQLLDREKVILEKIYSELIQSVSFHAKLRGVELNSNGAILQYLQQISIEDYFQLQAQVKYSVLMMCDAIIFPKEIYDNPEAIAKVDVDNLMIVSYGIAVAVNNAFELFWSEIIRVGIASTPDEIYSLVYRVNDKLVDDGYFPSESGSWNKNFVAVFNEQAQRQTQEIDGGPQKRSKKDFLHEFDNKVPEDKFMQSLASGWLSNGTYCTMDYNLPPPGKYSRVAKQLIKTAVDGYTDYKQMQIKRGIFHQFSLISQSMDRLKCGEKVEYDGKKYVAEPFDYEGEDVLGPDKLLHELTKNIFSIK